MLRKLFCLLLIGGFLGLQKGGGWAFAQSRPVTGDTLTVTLEEVASEALEVSPDIHQRGAQRSFAKARRLEARSNRFFTEFQATTGHAVVPGLTQSPFPEDQIYLDPNLRNDWDEWRPFNQIKVELTQPIYTFGKISESIEAARYGVDVEQARVDEKKLEVALRSSELYYNLLLAEQLYQLAEETGRIVDRAKQEIQRLLDEGTEDVDNADLFQVQLTEQEYKRRLVEVQERRKIARSALRRQLFIPEQTTLRLAANQLEPISFKLDSLAAYTRLALQNRPELKQADAGLAARKALVEAAQADYYPKLFFRGSAGIRYTPGRPRQPNPYIGDRLRGQSLEAGIGFRQNLNFLQTKAEVEKAKAERNEVRFQQAGARQLILFEVEEAYRQLKIARAALQAQEQSLSISKEWLGTEQVNFEYDLGDTENLVDAVRAHLEQEVAYNRAVHDYNLAVLRLLDAAGVLTERITDGELADND